MVMVVARKVLKYPYYKGRIYKKGEQFEVEDERIANKLRNLGRVAFMEAGPHGYDRRDMRAGPVIDIVALRREYQDIFGKRPFMGWDAKTIQQKIAEG